MKARFFTSSDEAEAAFYTAFESADVHAMMQVWAPDDEIVCVHPMGPRLVGREEIAASWRDLFKNAPAMHFQLRESRTVRQGDMAIHVLHEHISVGEDAEHRSTIIATNIYKLGPEGWRLYLHHASPAPKGGGRGAATTLH